MNKTLVAIHIFCTLSMVGLIWFVQIVHYPLMGQVGESEFPGYEASHTSRTTLVVMPLMLGEALTGLWLVMKAPPPLRNMAILGFALILAIWASTFFVSVPQHEKLAAGFNAAAHQKLVSTNWIRTIAWTARGILVCGLYRTDILA